MGFGNLALQRNFTVNPGCNLILIIFQAFTIMVSNALQLATINSVGDFILFLGKCFVTAVIGSVALVILKADTTLKFYAVPTLVITLFAFFVAHAVLSLYEVCTVICIPVFIGRTSLLEDGCGIHFRQYF